MVHEEFPKCAPRPGRGMPQDGWFAKNHPTRGITERARQGGKRDAKGAINLESKFLVRLFCDLLFLLWFKKFPCAFEKKSKGIKHWFSTIDSNEILHIRKPPGQMAAAFEVIIIPIVNFPPGWRRRSPAAIAFYNPTLNHNRGVIQLFGSQTIHGIGEGGPQRLPPHRQKRQQRHGQPRQQGDGQE